MGPSAHGSVGTAPPAEGPASFTSSPPGSVAPRVADRAPTRGRPRGRHVRHETRLLTECSSSRIEVVESTAVGSCTGTSRAIALPSTRSLGDS